MWDLLIEMQMLKQKETKKEAFIIINQIPGGG